MHFIIEKNIPFINGLLEPYGTVEYASADEFTKERIKDADCIVIRTRTKCGLDNLEGSKVSLIATATIGTDHIDLDYCQKHGIKVCNSSGCNAPAVAQYVFASILSLINRPISQYTIGIVGVGNVGKIIEKWARQLDMRVLLNDPPRQAAEGGEQWVTIEEIAKRADIITFHTPLDATTVHLADKCFFDSLRRSPIIINAARGPIVDNQALLEAINNGQVHHGVMDCWENEPNLNLELLGKSAIATPHIAGYSYEGKVRATRMALDNISDHFGLPHIEMEQKVAAGAAPTVTIKSILKSYEPLKDTEILKERPNSFEEQRNNYNLRHEVSQAKID